MDFAKMDGKKPIEIEFSKKLGWAVALVANVFLITFLEGKAIHGAFFVLRAAELWMLITLIEQKVLQQKQVVRFILIGMLIQLVWATAQWVHNGSLGLLRLGESILGPDIPGVAKIDLADGTKHIRAYGSFLHPNSLAAYLVILLSLTWSHLKKESRWFWMALVAWGLWITGSLAAWVAAATGILVLMGQRIERLKPHRKKCFVIAIIAVISVNIGWLIANPSLQSSDASIVERQAQISMSRSMALAHPLGIGLNEFTLRMAEFSQKTLEPWQHVPVHNVYYLVLNEWGIQGLILLGILIALVTQRLKPEHAAPWLLVLLLASMDHLLLTSWTGMMVLAVVGHTARPRRGSGISPLSQCKPSS
ncbi:O-antigen ligase family protein [Candidatus Peregrinibacteria bacterium]|nr:MAG: O-antigen ligase family protein [Candidatus Peregrinibacteria bacterium]